jgi:regulator of nucleoside diphosphate kinase
VPVFPGEEDIAAGRISVLTPVGIALIGLRVGDTAEWQTRSGEWKRLRILRVEPASA